MGRFSHCSPPGIALAMLAAISLACGSGDATVAGNVIAPPVMVGSVRISELADRIEATGQLVAKAEATVAAQVDGQITTIAVEEGDAVEQGQVLLEIDPQRRQLELADAQARLAEASAGVTESWRELDRIQRLSTRAAASRARLDQAQTQLSLARARQSGAEAQTGLAARALEDSTVRAPFSGLIARRRVSAGEYLSTGLPLFDVVALDPIEVEFTLAEIDSARVKIGHQVQIRVAPYPDQDFVGTVTVISPTIDPTTRTLRVKAELPNPTGQLRPGLFARADLGISLRNNVSMVPEEALVQRADGSVLFRLTEGDRVQRLRVRIGTFRDGWIEVVEGLEPDDQIVVRGQSDLTDGMVVSLRTRDGRPASRPPAAATMADAGAGN